jgi:predicted nuclease of predicted toxin-antitoxin system
LTPSPGWLQRVDFRTAPEAGFHTGTLDPEILRLAAEDNRIVVSHDVKTLPRHFGEFIQHHVSPGVIIVRQEVTIRDAAYGSIFSWKPERLQISRISSES